MGRCCDVLEAYIPRLGTLCVRSVSREDRDALVAFFKSLSGTSISLRFLSYVRDFEAVVDKLVSNNESTLCIIAEYKGRIIGVGEMYKLGESRCEAAITVSEEYRGLCIGTILLYSLLLVARSRGIRELVGYIHATNTPMFSILDKLGGRKTLSYGDVVAGYLLVSKAIERAKIVLASKGVKLLEKPQVDV